MIRYVKIDDELLAKAKEFTGIEDTSELLRDSIRTLVSRKRHSRRMKEKHRQGPQPTAEEYLASIDKFNEGRGPEVRVDSLR